jgi:uncharacterized protein (DUF2141 family)
MKFRLLAAWTLSALFGGLTACAGTQVSEKAMTPRPGGVGSIEVRIEGVSSDEGSVYASVYISTDGFPEDKQKAYAYRSAAATNGPIVLNFESVPAGWFAIAVLHDADQNEVLSMNFMAIPDEDYGFSNNPDSVFGPPPFDEAAVFLAEGETKSLVVQVQ